MTGKLTLVDGDFVEDFEGEIACLMNELKGAAVSGEDTGLHPAKIRLLALVDNSEADPEKAKIVANLRVRYFFVKLLLAERLHQDFKNGTDLAIIKDGTPRDVGDQCLWEYTVRLELGTYQTDPLPQPERIGS